ncbi:unnamed protein product [[Candida] boidinii]|nr:unnamed protein product [[Candida] boidinii]
MSGKQSIHGESNTGGKQIAADAEILSDASRSISMPSMGNRGFNSNGMMQNMVPSTPVPLPIQPEIIKGVPLDPLSTQIQEERFIANNKYLKNEHQITYVNVPGSNHPGVELFERLQLAFESGLEDESHFY